MIISRYIRVDTKGIISFLFMAEQYATPQLICWHQLCSGLSLQKDCRFRILWGGWQDRSQLQAPTWSVGPLGETISLSKSGSWAGMLSSPALSQCGLRVPLRCPRGEAGQKGRAAEEDPRGGPGAGQRGGSGGLPLALMVVLWGQFWKPTLRRGSWAS